MNKLLTDIDSARMKVKQQSSNDNNSNDIQAQSSSLISSSSKKNKIKDNNGDIIFTSGINNTLKFAEKHNNEVNLNYILCRFIICVYIYII